MTPFDNYEHNQWTPPWMPGGRNNNNNNNNRHNNNNFNNRPPHNQPRPPFPDPPGNQMNNNQMPRSAPPRNTPQKPPSTFAIDAGSIRNCMGRFTYIWLDNGSAFWFFPVQLSRRSVSGFRWDNRFGWTYFGISLDRIDSFTCV